MPLTREVNLSAEQAAFVDAQVASGRHASVSDVLGEALEALRERDAWLRDEVAPAFDEAQQHPERTLSADDWMAGIVELHAAHVKRQG